MLRDELASLLNPNHFHLILLPTENCNFRCTYCYEDFEIGRMDDITVQAIKALINKRLPKLHSLTLSWFGGEPLIAKDIVKEITSYAQQAAAAMEVYFHSDMTTNAYTLNKITFNSLIALGIRSYQISLDGDEDEHDKTRKLATNKGSFSKIWSNLLLMRSNKENFHTLLRVHIHGDNLESVKKLLGKIHHNFGLDTRFSIFLKPVGNWGGGGVNEMNLLKSSSEVVTELNGYLEQIGWNSPRKTVCNMDAPINACYAALPNSLVIRADGSLAKCTVAFNDPRNRVGKINDDGTLSIENQAMQSFMRGFQSMNAGDLHCPIKEMPMKEQVVQFHKNIELVLTT